MQIVSEKFAGIIDQTKSALENLNRIIGEHGDDSLRLKINSALESLDNLFLIVFMGEFSTGKSSIINALIGEKILEEGITPTTDRITLIKYGEVKENIFSEGIINISIPNTKFKNTYLVDTPGTNVTIAQHKKITEDFIPKADIIFFTIGAERAVTGSEYEFIKFLKEDWKKNVVFLLNKIDITKDDEELKDLLEYTTNELKRLFGITPYVIPISAKMEISLADHEKSGFKALNDFIFNKLNEEERIIIKLNNSLDLALNLCGEVEKTINDDLEKISKDINKLNNFSTQLDGMRNDIIQNSSQFTERIKGRLLEFKNRGIEFIDNLIRFENVLKLIRKDKIAKEFEDKVSMQTVKEIEKDMDDLVLWTEQSSKRMLDNVINFYRDSVEADSKNLNTPFMQNRLKLIDTIRSELEIRKQEIDPKLIGGNLVDSARAAVASVLGVQVGSLAIGATVVSAFSSFIVDITGVLTTLAIMATAFAILPKKRSGAMKEFTEKVDNLTVQLNNNIESQLIRDIENLKLQISDSLSPLRNFYKTQEQTHINSKENLEITRNEFIKLKKEIHEKNKK